MAAPPAPDRARGLFETLLILDGTPVELDAHLERLATSLERLFAASLPAGLAADIAERAGELRLGRMRIVVDPAGESSTLKTEAVDPADFFPAWERGAALRSVRCDGGLGAHKWADRRPLAEGAGEPLPLLLDRGDEVLEVGRANVFATRDGALFTPAADGRILPGTARAAVIDVAREKGIEVTEGRLTQAELLAADEVFLTGSVRGVEPACSLDEAQLRQAGDLGRRLGERLRRRWRTGRLAAAGS